MRVGGWVDDGALVCYQRASMQELFHLDLSIRVSVKLARPPPPPLHVNVSRKRLCHEKARYSQQDVYQIFWPISLAFQ